MLLELLPVQVDQLMLHFIYPLLANEVGIDFDIFDVAKIFRETPYIADLKPGGKYLAKHLHDIGGVPIMMKSLMDGGFLYDECMTVSGKSIKDNLKHL